MIDTDTPKPTDVQALARLDTAELMHQPDFLEWAGEDLQEAGVVTDGDKPALFFHGGMSDVGQFNTEQTPNTSPDQKGIYFSPDFDQARFYASKLKIDQADRGLPQESSIYAVALKMKNPYVVQKGDGISSETIRDVPRGHDGIVNPKSREVVVFDPSQIYKVAESRV